MRERREMRAAERSWRRGALCGLSAIAVAACNWDVTNPGPVQDSYLDQPSAHEALVNGASRALSNALGWIAYTGGVAALELQGSGNITQFGVTLLQREGTLSPNEDETDEHWSRAQRARWVAEEAVRRIEGALGEEFGRSALAARALLYVGYANRLLGENMCAAVIDGGGAEPRSVYFDRAHAAFSRAVEIAAAAGDADLSRAAYAGRASVRVWRDDWAGAAADAAEVPVDFEFDAIYSDLEIDQYNRIYWAGANAPFRAATVWSTFYEEYYEQTGDPRVAWSFDPDTPTGDGSDIPFYRQEKYRSRTDPVRLSSGREMRLIEAEKLLRDGDWPGAVSILNGLRGGVGLPAESPGSAEAAWTMLRRERAVELWLEGRQLGDVFRWEQEGAPGTHVQDLTGRDRCFPIGITEVNTNPNIEGPTG